MLNLNVILCHTLMRKRKELQPPVVQQKMIVQVKVTMRKMIWFLKLSRKNHRHELQSNYMSPIKFRRVGIQFWIMTQISCMSHCPSNLLTRRANNRSSHFLSLQKRNWNVMALSFASARIDLTVKIWSKLSSSWAFHHSIPNHQWHRLKWKVATTNISFSSTTSRTKFLITLSIFFQHI